MDEPATPVRARLLSAMAYLGPLLLVPLLLRTDDRFLAYHRRQGMYWFIVHVITIVAVLVILFPLRPGDGDPNIAFRILSVFLLLETALYLAGSVGLAVQAGRGRMPIVPILGGLAGES